MERAGASGKDVQTIAHPPPRLITVRSMEGSISEHFSNHAGFTTVSVTQVPAMGNALRP